MNISNRQGFESWDGTRISYQVQGNLRSEKVIVLVNGLFCTESYWSFLIRDLSEEYRIITWDLRGHQYSESPRDPQNVDIESSSRDLKSLIDHLGVDKPVLIGFSLGVQIIFEYFNLYPDRLAALVAVTGPYENPLSTFYGLPIPDIVWECLLGTFANKIPGITNTLWHAAFKLPIVHPVARLIGSTRADADLMQGFYDHQNIVDVPNGLRMALASIRHTARDILPRINVPTLVIGGEKDTFSPVKLSHAMRDKIPGVAFVMVDKGTHTTLIEKPDIVNSTVGQFLKTKVFPSQEKKTASVPVASKKKPRRTSSGKKTPAASKAAPKKKPAAKKKTVS